MQRRGSASRLIAWPRSKAGARRIPVRRLMSQLGSRHEPITYWIVVGGEVVTTGIGQKLAQMRYGVRGVIADGMLVRVVQHRPVGRARSPRARRLLRDLLAQVPADKRVRIVGADNARRVASDLR
ncbi:MAG: EpsI family protein [Burkholderiaceae bacterium]